MDLHITNNAFYAFPKLQFDARLNINVRGGKPLEIRVGGAVELPCVNINIVSGEGDGVG